jgi:hypothetical protein
LKEVQSRACQHVIEHNPDNCMSYQSTKAQLDCLYNTHTTNTRGCQMLAKLDPDEIFGSLDCMDEVDTDHALLCVQNYPDRKDREHCCAPVPDYLKDLCMEGPPPDKKAAEGDAEEQEGKKEQTEELGETLTLDEVLGSGDFSEEKATEICESLSSLPPLPPQTPDSINPFYLAFVDRYQELVLYCNFAKDDGYGLITTIVHAPPDYIQRRWDGIAEVYEKFDVSQCGQDELFASNPHGWSGADGGSVRVNMWTRRITPESYIAINEQNPPSSEITDLMQDLMSAAQTWITGGTLTLDEVLGEE